MRYYQKLSNGKCVLWSTVVDAPVDYIKEINPNNDNRDGDVFYNRAGPGEARLSMQEIEEMYRNSKSYDKFFSEFNEFSAIDISLSIRKSDITLPPFLNNFISKKLHLIKDFDFNEFFKKTPYTTESLIVALGLDDDPGIFDRHWWPFNDNGPVPDFNQCVKIRKSI